MPSPLNLLVNYFASGALVEFDKAQYQIPLSQALEPIDTQLVVPDFMVTSAMNVDGERAMVFDLGQVFSGTIVPLGQDFMSGPSYKYVVGIMCCVQWRPRILISPSHTRCLWGPASRQGCGFD